MIKATRMGRIQKLPAFLLVLGALLLCVTHFAQAQQSGEAEGRRGRRGGFSGRRGGFGRRQSGLLGVLRREEVRTEIKLTPEQVDKIEKIGEDISNRGRELFSGFRDASPEEREQLLEKMRTRGQALQEATDAELKKILSAEQTARVQQLSLHSQGLRALENKEIAQQIKISAEQQNKIGELIEQANQTRRERRRQGGGRGNRAEQQAELEQALQAVLTADQKQHWKKMLGPPPVELAEAGSQPEPRRRRRNRDDAPSPATNKRTPKGEPVVELSTTPAGAESKTATGNVSDDKKTKDGLLSFNFRFAPWDLVLRRFSEEAKLSLQMDVVPPGTLNYYDRKKYTPTEALDVLNGYLLQKGYLLVRRDRFLVVVNIDDGVPPNLVPQVSVEELSKRGNNELLTIVVPLDTADATTIAEEVKAMLGPQGKVVPMTNLNRLLITDTGGNLRRIHRLLTGEGADGQPKAQKFRAFPLKHVTAVDADRIIRDLFGLPKRGTANVSASATRSSSNRFSSRFDRFRSRDREAARPAPTSASTSGKIRVAIDERTNSLLVTASAVDLKIVEEAVKTIDVGEGPGIGRATGAGANRPQLEVYEVASADPREVTKTLDALLPGVVVNEDSRARRIHIFATPEEHRQIRAIIDQLDGASGQGVTVINLSSLDPIAATNTLRSLFDDKQGDAPTIEADIAGRRLLIRGSSEQLAQIKTLLAQLGEDGTGVSQRPPAERGPIRTISLGGRDSEELINLLKQVWGASGRNPIRVVVPSAVAPTIRSGEQSPSTTPEDGAETSDADLDEALEQVESAETPKTAADDDKQLVDDLNALLGDPGKGDPGKGETDKGEEKTKTTGAPIVIAPSGNNLIIASDDQEALDRIERLVESLTRATPRKQQWTVFYLRSSDALETAGTLGELFPTGSVAAPTSAGDSNLMGSLSSLGGNLMDMTGLASLGGGAALRIIPEPRLNALFVSGPAHKIEEIENVLKILDGGDLPESLRDRVPRRIEIEHTDVNEVAAIVRDVYKDYMQAPNQNRGGRSGGNPLAMMLGASQQQTPAPGAGIKLTLGVDTRTNTLIVSAADALFQQIQLLVRSLDESAMKANRTIRIVNIDRQSAPLIQQSLGALFGKIHVSTTSGGATPKTTSSASGAKSSQESTSQSQNDRRGDEIREFFERRMRERFRDERGGSAGGRRRGNRSESGSSGFPRARGRGSR